MLKKLLLAATASSLSMSALAKEEIFFSLGIGSFGYAYSIDGLITDEDGIFEVDLSEEGSDDGGLLILSSGIKLSRSTFGASVSLPNTVEGTSVYLIEGFGRYMVTESFYAGALAGYQSWTNSDQFFKETFGEELDMSGFTFGLTGGFEYNSFDFNLTHRFISGSEYSAKDVYTDPVFGEEMSFELTSEVTGSTQFSVSYQF